MKIITLAKETIRHWNMHNAQRMGAALSYYAVFSLVPILFFATFLASIIFNKAIVSGILAKHITAFAGPDLGQLVYEILQSFGTITLTSLSSIISLLLLVIGAIGIFMELNKALDELWSAEKHGPSYLSFKQKVLYFFKDRLIVFSIVPIAGLLLLFSVSLSIFVSFFDSSTLPYIGDISRLTVSIGSFILTVLLFGAIFRVLPNTKLPVGEIFLGAFVTAILFLIGRYLIVIYLQNIANTTLYAGAQTIILILIWVYYSAQVFFIGASFTYIYSKNYGYLKRTNTSESLLSHEL